MSGVMLAFAICVVLPLGAIAAGVLITMRRAQQRHAERMAMIAQGLIPPQRGETVQYTTPAPGQPQIATVRVREANDHAKNIGWAVACLVAGVLWLAGEFYENPMGVILTALGAMYLTRGILGVVLRSDRSEGEVR